MKSITAYFRTGEVITFIANDWSFYDVSSNNVCLISNGEIIAHLNWSEVLYIVKGVTE